MVSDSVAMQTSVPPPIIFTARNANSAPTKADAQAPNTESLNARLYTVLELVVSRLQQLTGNVNSLTNAVQQLARDTVTREGLTVSDILQEWNKLHKNSIDSNEYVEADSILKRAATQLPNASVRIVEGQLLINDAQRPAMHAALDLWDSTRNSATGRRCPSNVFQLYFPEWERVFGGAYLADRASPDPIATDHAPPTAAPEPFAGPA